MKFGIDRLLADPSLRAPLSGKRVALLAHPASVTADLTHSLDALMACSDIRVTATFGPQHGMRGDKQDNMMETADYNDPVHGVPVFSLYGEVRRPSGQMMSTFDVVLIDLQDLEAKIDASVKAVLVIHYFGFPQAIAALQAYAWPGNVRQLSNVMDWLLIMTPPDDRPINAQQLPPEIIGRETPLPRIDRAAELMTMPLREAREAFEREYLLAQIARFGGNISRTAAFIGMERSALHRKLKLLGVVMADRGDVRPRNFDA